MTYGVFNWKAVLQKNRLSGQTNLLFTAGEVTPEDFALNSPHNGWQPEDMTTYPVTICCDSPEIRNLLLTTELRSVTNEGLGLPNIEEAIAVLNSKLEGELNASFGNVSTNNRVPGHRKE
jgi:hypothetical protein